MVKTAKQDEILSNDGELIRFLWIIKEESNIGSTGFYDIHDICGKNKVRDIAKKDEIMEKIRKLGYKAGSTHFKGEGIRSNINIKDLIKILRNEI